MGIIGVIILSMDNQDHCPSCLIMNWLSAHMSVQPNEHQKSIERYQSNIRHITDRLIQEKKRKIEDAAANGKTYEGNDFLSRLRKLIFTRFPLLLSVTSVMSNAAKHWTPADRLSDDEIFYNVNTFLFAGADTTSVSLTWTLYLLAKNPDLQTCLRNELLSVVPAVSVSKLTQGEIHSLSGSISNLSYFHNVIRESLRLVPPVHSYLRVATKNDQVPTVYPVYDRHGDIMEGKRSITVQKGTFVHVPIEGFNLDKEVWGEDAWEFKSILLSSFPFTSDNSYCLSPDRWDALPQKVQELPGLLRHILTFSGGPRVSFSTSHHHRQMLTYNEACVGMQFSMTEMKTILYILLTHFVFIPTEDKIQRVNM